MLVRRSLLTELRGLTERWFMYAEDIEFCVRAKRMGSRVVVDTSVNAEHEVGGSSAGIEGKVGTDWLSNLYQLYLLHFSRNRIAALLWRGSCVLGYGARAVVVSLTGLRRPQRRTDAHRFWRYARAAMSMGQRTV